MDKKNLTDWLSKNQDPDPELFSYRLIELIKTQEASVRRVGWFKQWTGTATVLILGFGLVIGFFIWINQTKNEDRLLRQISEVKEQAERDIAAVKAKADHDVTACLEEKDRVDKHIALIIEALHKPLSTGGSNAPH